MRFVTLLLLLLAAGCARPEGTFPDREVRIVVHASPGGISDTVSRRLARSLQEQLGVPVVCENRVGAAGSLAFSYVAKSPPDGYTIGYAPVDLAIIAHLGYANVTPDDFDYLVLHTTAPASLAVRHDAPWTTLGEFVKAARAQPGRISMGSSGTGSVWHLASLGLAKAMGSRFNDVPFPGSGPAVTALLGGHVQAVVAGPAEVQAHVESGDLRLLAVMAKARSDIFPNVPTLREEGYDLDFEAWGGFMLPKGTPADRRDRLASAFSAAINTEAFRRFCRESGLEVARLGPAAFERFVRESSDTFASLVRETGLAERAAGAQ